MKTLLSILILLSAIALNAADKPPYTEKEKRSKGIIKGYAGYAPGISLRPITESPKIPYTNYNDIRLTKLKGVERQKAIMEIERFKYNTMWQTTTKTK